MTAHFGNFGDGDRRILEVCEKQSHPIGGFFALLDGLGTGEQDDFLRLLGRAGPDLLTRNHIAILLFDCTGFNFAGV